MSDDPTPSCSFCGKSQDAVSVLIAGPRAHVCEECVVRFVRVLKEKGVWPSAPVRLFRTIRYMLTSRGRRVESN